MFHRWISEASDRFMFEAFDCYISLFYVGFVQQDDPFTVAGWSCWSNDIGVPYEFSRPSPQTIDTRQDIRKLRQELMCLYGVDSLRRAPWTCRWILVWCEINYSDII